MIVVLDKSGSMGDVREATISAFNEFLEDQKKVPGEVLLTLVLFDTVVVTHHLNQPLEVASKLTHDNYRPSGMTALYDAVGATIDRVGAHLSQMPEGERPERVLVVIQTDGMENMSREYSARRVADMIEHQRSRYAWDFMFLGADQDAWLQAGKMGIKRGSTVSYDHTNVGTRSAMLVVNSTVRGYRTSVGGQSVAQSLVEQNANDIRDQKKAIKKAAADLASAAADFADAQKAPKKSPKKAPAQKAPTSDPARRRR